MAGQSSRKLGWARVELRLVEFFMGSRILFRRGLKKFRVELRRGWVVVVVAARPFANATRVFFTGIGRRRPIKRKKGFKRTVLIILYTGITLPWLKPTAKCYRRLFPK
jgi:hypothetical protein